MKNINITGIYIVCNEKNLYKERCLTGIEKKILDQIEAFKIKNIHCKLKILPPVKEANNIKKFFIYIFHTNYYNKYLDADYSTADFIYIRRFVPISIGLVRFIKNIKKINKNCKILYEIPTYPYRNEHLQNIKSIILLFIDIINRIKLIKYIDKIITYSNHNKIFGINTLKIINGINCNRIPTVKGANSLNEINLIAVGYFSFWHGYERLIKGIYNYYDKNYNSIKIYLHLVGDGPELKKYKNLVNYYRLNQYIKIYGKLDGYDLDKIYDISDIAICSLACHRKKIFLSSELKSREYLARGLPIVSSVKIDCISNDFKYCLYVLSNEEEIDIKMIIKYYSNILNLSKIEKAKLIREYAEKKINMVETMSPVYEYLLDKS